MNESRWFLEALIELREFSKDEGLEGVISGLAGALECFVTDTNMSEDERQKVMAFLRSDGQVELGQLVSS